MPCMVRFPIMMTKVMNSPHNSPGLYLLSFFTALYMFWCVSPLCIISVQLAILTHQLQVPNQLKDLHSELCSRFWSLYAFLLLVTVSAEPVLYPSSTTLASCTQALPKIYWRMSASLAIERYLGRQFNSGGLPSMYVHDTHYFFDIEY